MFKCPLAATVVLFTLAFSQVHAEPSRKVNYLMNQPVTLFSLGLFKLETDLKVCLPTKDSRILPVPLVFYEWNQNKLVVAATMILENESDLEIAKTSCRAAIVALRECFAIDASGNPMMGGTTSLLAVNFLPEGYSLKDYPSGIAEELDNITELRAVVSYGESQGLVCQGPVRSHQVLYEK